MSDGDLGGYRLGLWLPFLRVRGQMIIPGHVVLGFLEQPGFVLLKHGQIEERIDLVKLAGVNEAHKEVPDVGSMFGLEEVGIFSMEDSFFQSLFTKRMPTA